MRRFLLLFAAVFMALPQLALAAPALERLETFTQPNGATFKGRTRGDEWNHWQETETGYGIYKSPATKEWMYLTPSTTPAKTSADDSASATAPATMGKQYGTSAATASGVAVVGLANPAMVGIPSGLRPAPVPRPANAPRLGISAANAPQRAAVAGNRPLLVIGVEYGDQVHQAASTVAEVTAKVFGGTNSVKAYVADVSYGAATIVPASETSGTVNDGFIGWLNIGANYPNTGSNGFTGVADIARAALIAADASINFATYDTNGDNSISTDELSIVIIVAGYEMASTSASPSLWAHQWLVSSGAVAPVLDGKTVDPYAMFGEMHSAAKDLATYGIIMHELGHLMLGLPDLYDTGNDNSYGIGYFGIMGSGTWGSANGAAAGSSPVQLSAWSKQDISWGTVTTISGTSLGQVFPSADGTKASIFRINTADANQYFLIENRQVTGSYDIGFERRLGAGSHGGLVIFHVNKTVITAKRASNKVNGDKAAKGVDVEEADEGVAGSALDAKTSVAKQTMFYYSGNNATFNGASTPNSTLDNGSSTGIGVVNISASSASMAADVVLDTQGPSLLTLTPSTGSTGVAVTTTITASFNEAIDQGTLTTTNVAISPATAGTFAYNTATNIMTFTPTASLITGTSYTVIVTTGVTDLAGNGVTTVLASRTVSFTTSGIAPVVLGSGGGGGGGGCSAGGGMAVMPLLLLLGFVQFLRKSRWLKRETA